MLKLGLEDMAQVSGGWEIESIYKDGDQWCVIYHDQMAKHIKCFDSEKKAHDFALDLFARFTLNSNLE